VSLKKPLASRVLVGLGFCLIAPWTAGVASGGEAQDILSAAGVQGGLVVHVGCGEGPRPASRRASQAAGEAAEEEGQADGEKLAECRLDAPPVFDGMASAGGRLYLALQNGRVVCMAPK